MSLQEILRVLSKSSPYSVSTLRTGEPDQKLKTKNYLYVRSEIDRDFEDALQKADRGSLLFLCGSSGDGKSEILTRLKINNDFKHIEFHLDATHSKTQHGSAVDCLNDLFDRYKSDGFTLVIGINIGMMQKFSKLGADRHHNIKNLFKRFFQERHIKGLTIDNASFFDFECYPRIKFKDKQITSDFVIEFFSNLTRPSADNPFWDAYLNDFKIGEKSAKNFKLLCNQSLQSSLVQLLGLARLYDEQFLVPRTFVDFIYKLITSDNFDGLVGNLFTELDNDISIKVSEHDPLKERNEIVDNYLLAKATNTLDDATHQCTEYLNELAGIKLSSTGLIRLAFLLSEDIEKQFPESVFSKISKFHDLEKYLYILMIFSEQKISRDDEEWLLNYLERDFIGAVLRYINRYIHQDLSGYILSREVDGYYICNKLEIILDLDEIERSNHHSYPPEFLTVPFIVNNEKVSVDLDVKLLSLVNSIGRGYVPNINVQNEFAKLDEFVRDIVIASGRSEEIRVYEKNKLEIFYAEANKSKRGYTLKGACGVN